jgi:hypothetical protein
MRKLSIATAVIIATLSGCGGEATDPPAPGIIPVGSVGTPAKVARTGTFKATFTASSCYSLQRVDRAVSATAVDFVFVGVRTDCPAVPRGAGEWIPFIHQETIEAPATGELAIRVHGPSGGVLERQVVFSTP